MVKVVPNKATRRTLRARSSAAIGSTMLSSGTCVRFINWAMQMCGVTAGIAAAAAPARAIRSMNDAR